MRSENESVLSTQGDGATMKNTSDDSDQVAAMGSAWEQIGLTTQADYMTLDRITKGIVESGGVISDADLEWSLNLMKNSSEVIVRSRVMIMLGEVGKSTPLPKAQKDAILAALQPYLNSTNQLDRMSVLHVQRELQGR
jgi:hypothetical protein